MATPTTTNRVLRVPIEHPDDETWKAMRRLAYQCAAFGNHLLTESYAKAKGLTGEVKAYTDFNTVLSSSIRDAIGRECVGIWRREGRKILRGQQTLARFSADRALVVRERGVSLEEHEGKQYTVRLRLAPKSEGEATTLQVWGKALKRDPYLSLALTHLAKGDYRLTKATVRFRRHSRRVDLLISYQKSLRAARTLSDAAGGPLQGPHTGSGPEPLSATIHYSREPEIVFGVRGNGRHLSLNDALHRLDSMKQHFAGIRHRLSRCLNKRGRRRDYRLALLKAGTFERWADGPLHQLSWRIVKWCIENEISLLAWDVKEDGTLPLDRLRQLVEYKAQEYQIAFSQTSASSERT